MNENEAIQALKTLFAEKELDLPCTDSLEVLHVAVKALEDVQAYRAIGTPEECRYAVEREKIRDQEKDFGCDDDDEYIDYCDI